MKITRIEIGVAGTLSIGNYENYRPEVRLVADLEDDEGIDGALQNLEAICKHSVRRQALDLLSDHPSPSNEVVLTMRRNLKISVAQGPVPDAG